MIIIKNLVLFLLENKVIINVKGKNIERFIKRLKNNNISIYNIKYINNSEINITILTKDLKKVEEIKTIYKIEFVEYLGYYKYLKQIFIKRYIYIFLIFFICIIYVLSKMILSIDIITNDLRLKKNLLYDLNNLGIKKYSFKKNYNEIQEIKKIILDKYSNEIEWIEFENIGTKYIIRYEPRVINNIEENNDIRNIVAKKDAVIYSMNIKSGQIIKDVNSYVKKGVIK